MITLGDTDNEVGASVYRRSHYANELRTGGLCGFGGNPLLLGELGFSNTAQLVIHAYGGENDPGHNPQPGRVPQLGLVHDRKRGAIGELLDLNRAEDVSRPAMARAAPASAELTTMM